LALLIGIGTIVPLATEYAEAGPRKNRKYKKKQKKYKKYSKGWWRERRKREKYRKSLAARKRSLRLRQLRLAKAKKAAQKGNAKAAQTAKSKTAEDKSPAVLPTGEAAPKGWKRGQNSTSELQFQVDDSSGSRIGSAAISVVGPAMSGNEYAGKNKTIGGVPTTSLRRTVIDQMVRENGWVVNDYQKQVGGNKVYVVVAQSQDGGKIQSRMFYFTEAEGRIYSVATNSPTEAVERLAEESEKVINSLQRRTATVQQAELK
jgi:vacuolar-type H+-ATPase subunit I/STV1